MLVSTNSSAVVSEVTVAHHGAIVTIYVDKETGNLCIRSGVSTTWTCEPLETGAALLQIAPL